MPLLLDEDYADLKERGISFDEAVEQRFFIFLNFQLREGLYTIPGCDVLVVIPQNYNQAGNDMFWTNPRLYRANGVQIPAVMDPGGGDNRVWKAREFCRWSRHWDPARPGVWRPGKDGIIAIYRRIQWALEHPECQ